MDLYNGISLQIIHLDNKPLKVKVKKEEILKNDNLIIKYENKGLPHPTIKNKNGNLYIRLIIEYPKFDETQIDKLNELFNYQKKEEILNTNIGYSKYDNIFVNSFEN